MRRSMPWRDHRGTVGLLLLGLAIVAVAVVAHGNGGSPDPGGTAGDTPDRAWRSDLRDRPGADASRHPVRAARSSPPVGESATERGDSPPEAPGNATCAVVYGTVRSERPGWSGAAWIRLENEDSDIVARTDARGGHFAMAGVRPGRYVLHAEAMLHKAASRDVDATEGAGPFSVDLTLRPADILYLRFATDDGRRASEWLRELPGNASGWVRLSAGIGDTSVGAEMDDSEFANPRRRTGATAWDRLSAEHYQVGVDDEWDALLEIRAARPVRVVAVLRNTVVAAAMANEGDASLTLVCPRALLNDTLGAVTARVVDGETAKPAVAASVAAFTMDGLAVSGRCDPSGVVTLRALPAGSYLIGMGAPGKAPVHIPASVRRGCTVDMGDVALYSRRCLRGRVTGVSDGRGVDVEAVEPGVLEWGLPAPATRKARTDAQGAFELDDVGIAPLVLRIVDGTWTCFPVDVQPDDAGSAEIVLRAERASRLRVCSEEDKALEVVIRHAGRVVMVRRFWGSETLRLPRGRFVADWEQGDLRGSEIVSLEGLCATLKLGR